MVTQPPLFRASLAHLNPVVSDPSSEKPAPLPIPLKLVERLEALYPDRMPNDHTFDPMRLSFEAGRVSLVRFLRAQYENQKEL